MIPFLRTSQGFSFLRFTLLLIFISNNELLERTETYRQYFQRDLNFCAECFQHQTQLCTNFFDNIEYDFRTSPLQNILILLPTNGKRATEFLQFKNSIQRSKIIAKYLTQQKLATLTATSNDIALLKQQFFDSDRLDGLQFCPAESVDGFVKYLQKCSKGNSLNIWLHLLLNIEPLLMPHLEELGFPVPMNFAVCGFTLYQAYAGEALVNYFNSDFKLKIRIAKKLLEAAIKFTKGFANYRLYITDLSPDNIVFDELNNKIYFIDLDTVLIVDSGQLNSNSNSNSIHKHIFIECKNCFAYSQQNICSNNLSDINLFSVCQFLRENLSGEREHGFLYPIPNHILKMYRNFKIKLDNCVDCMDKDMCTDRFAATLELIEMFNVILKNYHGNS